MRRWTVATLEQWGERGLHGCTSSHIVITYIYNIYIYTFIIVIEVWWISFVTHLFVWNLSDMFCIALFCCFFWVQSFRFDTVGSLWAWDGHYSDSCAASLRRRDANAEHRLMGNDGKLNPHSSAAKKAPFHIASTNIQKLCHFTKKKGSKGSGMSWNWLERLQRMGCLQRGHRCWLWHPAQRKTTGFAVSRFHPWRVGTPLHLGRQDNPRTENPYLQ